MDEKHTSRAARLTTSEDKSHLRGVLDQVKMIATGGMAHIFRARQPSLERFIVVKKLKEELLQNAEIMERFRREAKALASVLHQNVAHVYDFVEEGSEAFILMEFIEGIDLSQIIQKAGSVPPDVAALILLNVAKGVSHIHSRNLVHRDIKPANIRVSTRGEVKLMDFGIVMELDNETLTRPGMMVGSPSYLSPEQVIGDPITPKADIFLLGICLYEMLTGTRPFKEEGGKTVFQKIRESEFIPVRQMNGLVPKALDRIVSRCLTKNPEDRYANVKALAFDLENFVGSKKSSHADDILLKFLDGEALLTPAIPYTDLDDERRGWRELFQGPFIFVVMAITLLAFGFGYFAGVYKTTSGFKPQSNYPPTQNVGKKEGH